MPSVWVEDNILEHSAELDGVENIRLLLSGEANALGIALRKVSYKSSLGFGRTYPSLDVENTAIAPAVLIVTDQSTVGVS